MERHVEEAIRCAARDGIVVVRARDTSAELTVEGVRHQAREGRLEHLGLGVWKLRDHPWDWRCRARAALAFAGDGSCLGLRTAAHAYRWYRYRSVDAIEVIVRRGRDQRTRFGRIVQTRFLPPQHVVVHDGLPMTSPARTFFDLCGDPDRGLRRRGGHPIHARNMERVFNDVVARRGVTFAHEAAVHLVLARRGRRGTVLVRKLLLKHGPSYVPTQSEAESLFVEVLEAYAIPEPKRQVPTSGADGFIGVVDFLWPEARHIVEVDSRWHDGPLDAADDVLRDARLAAAGYSVARYRYGQMVANPAAIARELGAALGVCTPTAPPS